MPIPTFSGSRCDIRRRLAAVGLVLLASAFVATGCGRPATRDSATTFAADSQASPQEAHHRGGPALAELRGVWVSDVDSDVMTARDRMAALAAQISELNMNALYPVVWSQGETFYPSDVLAGYGGGQISKRYGLREGDRDPMADWLELGAEHGLAIVPWFEWGLKLPLDAGLAQAHPEWLSRDHSGNVTFDQDGIPTVYLNFVHPDVQRFYEELVAEFVTRYDVSAIQFDDHLSLKNTFGYDDFTLALYRQETGHAGRPEPAADDWLAWRASKLTSLISRISAAIKRARPGTRLSISPNPYPWSYRNYVQDWPSWVEAGLVDDVVVQVYRDNLDRFSGEIRSPVLEGLRGKARIAIGVMAGQKPAPVPVDMIRAQTALVRECGYAGMVYFFQESLLRFIPPGETVESRRAAIRQLFPTPAQTP